MIRSRHYRRILAGSLAGLLLLLIGLGTWNALRPLPVMAAQLRSVPNIPASANVAWPAAGEAAVGAVGYGVTATSSGQKALPTASVIKTMASLAILQKLPLKLGEQGPSFTVSQADVDRYSAYVAQDGSVLPVTVGEQLTEYQILEAMMIPSANNIADSAAIWVFGSLDNYFAAARQLAAQLGMTNTAFGSDASGLNPGTTSTPADLVRLGQAALADPVLTQIMGQRTANLPVVGVVSNYNTVLGSHGVIGIKTGNSDQAGGCFLFAAKYSISGRDLTVVGAIVGAADLASALSESLPLLDSAQANFSVATPVHKGDVLATYTIPWGGTAQAVAAQDVSLLRWNGTPVQAAVTARSLQGAQTASTKAGSVHVVAGDQKPTVALTLKHAIPKPGLWWRLTHH